MARISYLKYFIIFSFVLIFDIILALCFCLVYTRHSNNEATKVPITAKSERISVLCGCKYRIHLLTMERSSKTRIPTNCIEYPAMILPSTIITQEENFANITSYPYLVSINGDKWYDGESFETRFLCNGVIIDKFWVLTASGCIKYPIDLMELKIRAGSSYKFKEGSFHEVTEMTPISEHLVILKVNPMFIFNENLTKIFISPKGDWVEAVSVGWNEEEKRSIESAKISVTKWQKIKGDYTNEFGRMGNVLKETKCTRFTGRPLVSECNILIGIGYCYDDEMQYFVTLHVEEILNKIFKLLYKSRNSLTYNDTEINIIYGDDYTPLVDCLVNSN